MSAASQPVSGSPSSHPPSTRLARVPEVWRLGWFLGAVLVALAGAGYAYYRMEQSKIRQERSEALAAIAELKSRQLTEWRQQRLADARRAARSLEIRRWEQPGRGAEAEAEMRQLIEFERAAGGYSAAWLVPADPVEAAAAGVPDEPEFRRTVAAALAGGHAGLSELFRGADGGIHLDAVAPVRDHEGRARGAVVLRSDAEKFLYPFIQSWPTPSASAETLLVRHEGGRVVFLNELRHRTGTALSFSLPLARTDIPAVQAVVGQPGIFEGFDYREVRVLSDVRAIPDSPWFMVAKVDAEEIFAEARYRAGFTGLVVALLGLMAAGAVAYLLRRREAEQARTASRLKSDFLTMMSHEIRTPMNAVLGMTGLLLAEPLTAAQRRRAEVVRQSAEGLLGLLNDLLDFSRIEAGKLRMEPGPVDLRRLAEDAAALLTPQATAKGLALRCEFSGACDRWVEVDGDRLRQVLLNLLGNAVKFTDRGEVVLRLATEVAAPGRCRVRGEVRDTGVGIAPAAQAELFQWFVQAGEAPARRQGGSGLGLAISKQLLGLMGGTIGVDSALGRGARFWFDLVLPLGGPLTREAARAAEAAPLAPARGPGLDLLVAEDNPTNQLVLRQMLEAMGHRVVVAGDGAEALRAAAAHPCDVILMDCQMPVLDGYAATRAIRAGQAGGVRPDLPVIALTAFSGAEDRARCLAAGMSDYLTKPLRPADLGALLGRLGFPGMEHLAAIPPPVAPEPIAGLPVLDATQTDLLRRLPGRRGPVLLPEVLTLFLAESSRRIEGLRRLCAAPTGGAALRTESHQLAGACANVGAPRLRAAALALEAASDPAHRGRVLGQLELEWTRTQVALHHLQEEFEHAHPDHR